MREARIPVAGTELVIRLNDRQVERLRRTGLYRHAIGPGLRRLRARRNGHAPAAAPAAPAPRPAIPVYQARALPLPEETPEQRALAEQVRSHQWYHTIDLGHGVWTPGYFDHVPALSHFPLPADLSGKRCLDVATFDGFWAFEMERRGADEVVALDIDSWLELDLPPYAIDRLRESGMPLKTGAGFAIAAGARESKVQRTLCNVYDLSPDLAGQFDIVFCSDLLIHLTNPIHVLQNAYSVCRDQAIFVETVVPQLDDAGLGPIAHLIGALDHFTWWGLSVAYLTTAIKLAGFARVEVYSMADIRPREQPEVAVPRAIFRAFRDPAPEGDGAAGDAAGAR
jgi:tRNA (mo5U34)-methyltransferase